jgi:hypothetical protein
VTTEDEDRIAYLAGEPVESLTPPERAELDELRTLLQSRSAWEEPDPGLEDRVVEAIDAEAGAAEAAVPAARKDARRRFRPRALFARPAFVVGSVCAAASAAIVAAVLAGGGGGPAPSHFAMVVHGTRLAPGARGSAMLTRRSDGWEINLSVSGLPRRENDLYYEAWLENAAGVLVPVGTFNNASDVTLWSGVPVTQFQKITVTQQRANGDPASSGKRVLTGTIAAGSS